MSAPVEKCPDCGQPFGVTRWRYTCEKCKKVVCSACNDFAVLPAGKSGASAMLECCRECSRQVSSIDYSRSVDVVGPEGAPALVFVHGGGGTRQHWAPQIRVLSQYYRCIAMDLPGHASQLDTPLSLASAEDAIVKAMHDNLPAGTKAVYFGMSLGGYIGMDIVARNPELFHGAIICAAGQTVGIGRSFAASAGLVFLETLSAAMRHKTLAGQLMSQGKHIPVATMDELLRSGFFFQHTKEQAAVLRASNPLVTLPKYEGPILFVNGDLDHHDGQEAFLKVARHGKLICYPGTDHFFASDARFAERFLHDVLAWLREVGWVGVGL